MDLLGNLLMMLLLFYIRQIIYLFYKTANLLKDQNKIYQKLLNLIKLTVSFVKSNT